MKYVIRLFTILLFLAGCVSLVYLSTENNRLAAGVSQLEAELGRMSIEDTKRIHFVAVEVPDVPPEVTQHVERVWQFRCYLPPGYDFMQLSGAGRVTKDGIYQSGGSTSSWGTPNPEEIHKLLTVSIQKKDDKLEAFYSFGGSSASTAWNGISPDRLDGLVIQSLVRSDRGPRSFDQSTILPLLKIYDPDTAEDEKVAGNTLTTYAGGMILLCPRSREAVMNQLRSGQTPSDYEPSWIATDAYDE